MDCYFAAVSDYSYETVVHL